MLKTEPILEKIQPKPGEIEVKTVSNGQTLSGGESNEILQESLQESQGIQYKKKEYRRFIKLIKEGKYTTAIMTAKILGVTRQTISVWLQTPRAIQAMNEEVNQYVAKIKSSNDWKASAYLLDRITPEDEHETKGIDLHQLIVIKTT